MTALLSYGEQAFWVSNATKDLLYELCVAVAKCENSAAHQRLMEDVRLAGCYGVSGLGFELEAFAEAFGGKHAWQEAIAKHSDVVQAFTSATPAGAVFIRKLFAWIWFLLSGGTCNDAAGEHSAFDNLPEVPGTGLVLPVKTCKPTADHLNPGPWAKMLWGVGFGAFIGTVVGVANLLTGLAKNGLTIPAWSLCGALLGSAHPVAETLLERIIHRPGR
ncbi:MAG TPA: hypothetical protein VKU02_17910 [Gemmataceae bacterium]|nr:hypothetical protein [Gemmataceae bacterium]